MFSLLCRHFGVRPRVYAGEPSFQALRNRRQQKTCALALARDKSRRRAQVNIEHTFPAGLKADSPAESRGLPR
jgi:hypothetical protein